jgi:hypothetical protein
MALSTTKKALVTLVVMALFVAVLVVAMRQGGGQTASAPTPLHRMSMTSLKGLIAVDVENYFKDGRVIKRLADRGYALEVARVGSRDMAARLNGPSRPDFLFSSGVVAAGQIIESARDLSLSATQITPFHSPTVIASWEPIARILVANDIARPLSDKVYAVDIARLTELMLQRRKWKDLKQAQAYPVNRSVLVSTTDLRRSNSGALWLALTSYAHNGDVVSDRTTAVRLAGQLAELFKRQGYQENYVNGNFDDYIAIGMGKTPMAFIYEYQLVSHALQHKGIGGDMVLMYPQPTLINKEVFIALNESAKGLGELLAQDAELQALAVEHGFRIANTERFIAAVSPTGLAIEPRLTQVVDPPAHALMTDMIDTVAKEMAQ